MVMSREHLLWVMPVGSCLLILKRRKQPTCISCLQIGRVLARMCLTASRNCATINGDEKPAFAHTFVLHVRQLKARFVRSEVAQHLALGTDHDI